MEDNKPQGHESIGAKVRLLPGYDEVYLRAWVGSLAWIKDFKVDEYGYDKLWVEWDAEDWRYNGEPDCWTYPSHFEIIEPPPTLEEIARQATEIDSSDYAAIVPIDEARDEYLETITNAFDGAAGGDAFILISINREIDPDTPVEELVPLITTASLTDEATHLLNVTLSQITRIVRIPGPGGLTYE